MREQKIKLILEMHKNDGMEEKELEEERQELETVSERVLDLIIELNKEKLC
jgi:hypothetical protein